MDKERIEEEIRKLLERLEPVARINIVYDLFTSNLLTTPIGKQKVQTFGELKIGDMFIMMPRPGDDHAHGGLKKGERIFIKVKGTPDPLYEGGKKDNAMTLDGIYHYFNPGAHVLKIHL